MTADSILRACRSLGDPIDRFQVLGDRCSGTNFLTSLLERNFPELHSSQELGWKHGFIDRRRCDSPGILTVVIYRHPVRWMQSFYRSPYEVSARMKEMSFAEFIRARWDPVWTKYLPDGSTFEEPLQGDMYPHSTRRFENICRMRNVKIAYLEELAQLPCQVAFFRFETLNRNPKSAMEALAEAFDLNPIEKFQSVRDYRGEREQRYRPRRYPLISGEDRAYLRAELSREQEARIGYDVDMDMAYDGLPWTRRFPLTLR